MKVLFLFSTILALILFTNLVSAALNIGDVDTSDIPKVVIQLPESTATGGGNATYSNNSNYSDFAGVADYSKTGNFSNYSLNASYSVVANISLFTQRVFNLTYDKLLNFNCPLGFVFNGTYINGTHKCTNPINATYTNTSRLLNQNCPTGQIVNGTYGNGTFKCTTISGSSFLTDQNNNNLNKSANITFRTINITKQIIVNPNAYTLSSPTTKNVISASCQSNFPNTQTDDMCVSIDGGQVTYGGTANGVKKGAFKIDSSGNIVFWGVNAVIAEVNTGGGSQEAWRTSNDKTTTFHKGLSFPFGDATIKAVGSIQSSTGIECQGTTNATCSDVPENLCNLFTGCTFNLCNGVASACSTWNADETSCSTYGCTPEYNICGGTHNACNTYGEGDCTNHGCSWQPYVGAYCGGSLDCSLYGDGDCQLRGQCSWDGVTCSNIGACSNIGDQGTCDTHNGCGWIPEVLAGCSGSPHDCSVTSPCETNDGCSLIFSGCGGTAGDCGLWTNNQSTCQGAGCSYNTGCNDNPSISNSNCNQVSPLNCSDMSDWNCTNTELYPAYILKNDANALQQNISSMGDDVYFETNSNGSWIFKNGTGYGTIISGRFVTASKVPNNSTDYLSMILNLPMWIYPNGTINKQSHYSFYSEMIKDNTKKIKVQRNVTECYNTIDNKNKTKKVCGNGTVEVEESGTKTFEGLDVETRLATCEGSLYQIAKEMCDKDKNKWSWCQ